MFRIIFRDIQRRLSVVNIVFLIWIRHSFIISDQNKNKYQMYSNAHVLHRERRYNILKLLDKLPIYRTRTQLPRGAIA